LLLIEPSSKLLTCQRAERNRKSSPSTDPAQFLAQYFQANSTFSDGNVSSSTACRAPHAQVKECYVQSRFRIRIGNCSTSKKQLHPQASRCKSSSTCRSRSHGQAALASAVPITAATESPMAAPDATAQHCWEAIKAQASSWLRYALYRASARDCTRGWHRSPCLWPRPQVHRRAGQRRRSQGRCHRQLESRAHVCHRSQRRPRPQPARLRKARP
jgi:hypothetical protein